MVAILDITMAANNTVENVPGAIVDLKNVCLYTKLMFILYLEADIWINIFS